MKASSSIEGRKALKAYQQQRQIMLSATEKFSEVERLLAKHFDQRTIVFTQDNATAYELSKRLLIPVITHQTKTKERNEILNHFRSGVYGVIATSKVLNEGVDVPEASVAIVMSGSGSVREHVQRLGRILRQQENKRAVLYELITAGTNETYISRRRREHAAYKKK